MFYLTRTYGLSGTVYRIAGTLNKETACQDNFVPEKGTAPTMKKLIATLLCLSLLICAGFAWAAGGGAEDPLISLSFLKSTIFPSVVGGADMKLEQDLGIIDDDMSTRIEIINDRILPGYEFSSGYAALSFETGGRLTMNEFTSFVLTSGAVNISIDSGEIIDISTGLTVSSGTILRENRRYFATEGTSALVRVYSPSALAMVDGYFINKNAGSIPAEMQFIDVPITHWANENITYLTQYGIVNGVGNYQFAPSTAVTRGMFVTILGRLFGVSPSDYLNTDFVDVDINKWYGAYIAWAAEKGIVTGYGDGNFGPDDNISREQMAVILVRYAAFADLALPIMDETTVFGDQSIISTWAIDAVAVAQSSGIMNGKPGNVFDPGGNATRAEMCKVTHQLSINTQSLLLIT